MLFLYFHYCCFRHQIEIIRFSFDINFFILQLFSVTIKSFKSFKSFIDRWSCSISLRSSIKFFWLFFFLSWSWKALIFSPSNDINLSETRQSSLPSKAFVTHSALKWFMTSISEDLRISSSILIMSSHVGWGIFFGLVLNWSIISDFPSSWFVVFNGACKLVSLICMSSVTLPPMMVVT